jgi:putative ABC transport system ATP-binding protein
MIIDIKNISKTYGKDKNELLVLQDLSLKVESPSSVAIIGKSGSGKSTFLSLGAGLDKPDSGSIVVNNKDITSLSESELATFRAKNIGIIFQQFHLMKNLTALENVLLPLEILKIENPLAKAKECLKKVGLEQRAAHFPHELSGGEKQRVAIARAIVTEPRVIFADEPSGNLDEETGREVMSLLFDLVKNVGTTMILVTHDIELSKRCDEIYQLKNHRLEKQ